MAPVTSQPAGSDVLDLPLPTQPHRAKPSREARPPIVPGQPLKRSAETVPGKKKSAKPAMVGTLGLTTFKVDPAKVREALFRRKR